MVDRGGAGALTRDFLKGRFELFRARMAPGWYSVTVFFGDKKAPHHAVHITAERSYATTVPATQRGQFVSRTFVVHLQDKQLNLGFIGNNGSRFALNGVRIVPWSLTVDAGSNLITTEGDAVQFQGQATGQAAAYLWNFGDGTTTSGTLTPTKTFTEEGIYPVILTVTDVSGVRRQDVIMVTVHNGAPTATFGNGGSVNEGSAGSVSFANQLDSIADTAAGFRYSYDFDNDGTFEVVNSTSATRAVPAAYLADGPGARIVRGRIIDQDGAGRDYTTAIAVNNVAPSVSFSTNMTNLAVTFIPTVSDPGSLDTFTYSWSFGDNTPASAQASPTHTYAQSGVYQVVLAVTDKDGATTTVNSDVLVDGQLIHQNNLQYLGAFRVPDGNFGSSTFDYGGTSLTFNPVSNSLFIVGHDQQQAVAEISIPQNIVNSSNLSDLSTATVLQPFVSVLGNVPNWTLEGTVKVGGLLVADGELIGSAYEFYDAEGNAIGSHFKLDSLNLSSANVTGLFELGGAGAGFVAGYMASVPEEWQSALGASYVTGQAALSIIGRTSLGPALFGFDPTNLTSGVNPATPYVYYPLTNPTLGAMTGPANPLFNGATEINGVFFAPGTRSVVFFGSTGMTAVGYGEAVDFNDDNRTSKGFHAQDGVYAYQAWAYDINDFIDVKNGVKEPWEITPYERWNFDFPQAEGAKHIGGVAFDAATGRLYISQRGGDTEGGFAYRPVIQVYQLTLD